MLSSQSIFCDTAIYNVSIELSNFINAILNHESIETCKKLINKINDINEVGRHYKYMPVTALQLAIQYGYEELIDDLIERGANVNIDFQDTGSLGQPLYIAAANGFLDVVDKLLLKGANINAIGKAYPFRITALIAALENGHKAIADKLLAAGADITIVGQCYDRKVTAAYYSSTSQVQY